MKHLFPGLVLLCLISLSFADDCSNPLLSVFGFPTGQLQSGSGLNYCKSLKSGNSCCSASIVNDIQDKANDLASRLIGNATLRDKANVDGRKQIINIQPDVQKITELLPTLTTQLNQNNSPVIQALQQIGVQPGSTNGLSVEDLKTGLQELLNMMIPPLQQSISTIYNNLATLQNDFKSFQRSRSACAVELIKLQASAWCLACDPAYASKGVSGTTISMSSRTCNRLQSACYNYITYSSAQAELIIEPTASTMVSTITTMIEKLINGDISGYTDFVTFSRSSGSLERPIALSSSSLPTDCTAEGKCSWICSSLFNNGVVDETLAIIGGQLGRSSARILIEGDENEDAEGSIVQTKLQEKRQRALQSSEWNPDADEAGVQVTFPDDPANINGSGLVRISLSLMCLIGFLIAMML